MTSKAYRWLGELLGIDVQDRLKVAFLSGAFFLIIGAYTIAKELKDSLFTSIVGKEYIPIAKWPTMILLVPITLLYAKLVDSMRRYQLLALCSAFFGIGGLLIAYFIGHEAIGLINTEKSPYRIFGWVIYLFVEGYMPFLVNVLWAFANSITSPEGAKKNYAIVVACSKVGGMITAATAWALFTIGATTRFDTGLFSDVGMHQAVFAGSSLLLLLVPPVLWLMMRKVPGKDMHGYEAAYQVEKQKKKEHKEKTGVFAGISLLLKYPYVMGIFSMIFFYEVTNTVLSYLRIIVAESSSSSVSGLSGTLFKIVFMTHAVGFIISLFGTRALLRTFGERICLILVPITTGILLLYFMMSATAAALVATFVVLRSINYAFSWPVRESLYIPTVKEIKFKSRAWIDAFGAKFAKSTGSVFNLFASWLGQGMFLTVHSFFFASLVGLWFIAAFLLGKRFEWAVDHNEVIGAGQSEEEEGQEA